jgi:hypothetical protein
MEHDMVSMSRALWAIAVTLVVGLLAGGLSAAPAQAATPARADVSTQIDQYATENPDQFAAAIALLAATKSVVEVDGVPYLKISPTTAAQLDPKLLALLTAEASTAQAVIVDETEEATGIPSTAAKILIKFIKKYWSSIVSIAKKSGKYAWWKATRCAAGALNAL